MSSLTILNDEEFKNYDEKDVLKVCETFSLLDGYYTANDKLIVLRSLYVKLGNTYKVCNYEHEITKKGYENIYGILNIAYQNSNMVDEDFRQYLKPIAIQKTYYDENNDLEDRLSDDDLSDLFKSSNKYNNLEDYYEKMAYKYGTTVLPAWSTLGYAIQNNKIKVKKR